MYNHNAIEKKWQKYWEDNHTHYFNDNNEQKKYYVLNMFPYPSGAGLHVGHVQGYTQADIVSRYKHFCGFNVLQPMGWDAFGLPAEHFALKNKQHPQTFNQTNIANFRRQLKSLGFAYDYRKEVDTTDPKFYEWTQWIFIKLCENDLAELREVEINWCEQLGTALANEEIIQHEGKMVTEHGKYPVIKKPMKQWVLKITKYADKLIEGLQEIDWKDSIKAMQTNWIGRSEGAVIQFKTKDNINFTVFTTRPDTIYGVTYLAFSPENPLVEKITTPEHQKNVQEYIENAKAKTDLQRNTDKEKTGVFTGNYAINPITNKEIPIYIADYVLNTYATGIVMGVPAHDERDFAFAKKYELPIVYVIKCEDQTQVYTNDGEHINSDIVNGLNTDDACAKIINYLEEIHAGKKHITYKIHDWIFSRQRYWGEPFPILFDENNKMYIDHNLPIVLPFTNDIEPTGTGEGPLANLDVWKRVTINGKTYRRESNTMPQWAGSSWYFLAYLLKQPDGSYLPLNSPESKAILDKWMPVDFYDGGMEHAVLHLLYARFWHRFLFDIGVTSVKEPFQRLIDHGMILGNDGHKMSKSIGNVINPDDVVASHGADALRTFEMFLGPVGGVYPWNTDGLDGIRKWLERVYRIFLEMPEIIFTDDLNAVDNSWVCAYNLFIKKATDDLENIKLNLVVSEMMVFINECYKQKQLYIPYMKNFLIVLSCYAPHLTEEINSAKFNANTLIYNSQWPTYDPTKIVTTTVNLPIQINGKFRETIEVPCGIDENTAVNLAKANEKISKLLENKSIKKIIYVADKILNFIVSDK